jgi:hypothetical protein
MNEMEGKSIPYIKPSQQISSINEEKSRTLDSLV